MSRLFYHVMQDNAGNLLFDVTGTMRIAGSGTLATIYGDEALTVILPNPITNHPSFGSFKCFLGAGAYDFYMAKGGYTFETLTGVQGHGTMAQQNANAVAITGGAAQLSALGIAVGAGSGGASIDVQAQHPTAIKVRNYFLPDAATAYVGEQVAAAGSWNLYMSGTAQNYLKGFLGIDVPGGVPSYPLHVAGAIYGTTTMGLGTVPGTTAALRIQPQVGVGVQVEDFFVGGQAIAYAGLVNIGAGTWNCYMGGTAGNYFAGNMAINSTNVSSWQLHVNGTMGIVGGAGAIINSTSHAALKQDIRPLEGASAVIAQLPVRQWEWADAAVEAQLPGTQAGFVIEEMAEVQPQWVRRGQDGQTGLAMTGLDAFVVATLQEVLRRLEALEAAQAPK